MKHKIDPKILNTTQQLENIISILPGHIYWKDRNGILLGCNNEQASDIGLSSRHDVVGLTAYDTLPKDLADAITTADNKVMESGVSQTVQEILTLPNGKKSIWLSRKVPLYDEDKIVGILGVSLDVTEIEHTKKKLRETEHKLEAMTSVSASIAHELRTPLATLALGIKGIQANFSALLSGYKMAQEANLPVTTIGTNRINLLEQTLTNLQKEIRGAFNFIDMLLVKLQPSVSAKSANKFSIKNCIEDTLTRYPFQADQREWIKLNLAQDFQVQGDELLVTHVFFNLLKNALYFTIAAGKKEGISITLASGKKYNKVLFRDTGKGIPADILPKIFDRFFSKTTHGAGVGLTFSKMVMQSLGGKIACSSVENEFTLFTLSFPKVDNCSGESNH